MDVPDIAHLPAASSDNGDDADASTAMSNDANANAATTAAAAAATKRYRAAPAKTFQCRGYGDCRMVFSRSEHLARHVRCVALLSCFFAG